MLISANNAEKRAWRIVVVSFVIFLAICGAAVYGVQWFVFSSMTNLDVELTVARGTVKVILPNSEEAIAVTGTRNGIEPGTRIQTDENSQGLLVIYDVETSKPLASMTIHRDSKVTIVQAQGPRLYLNSSPNFVEVSLELGRVELTSFDAFSGTTNVEIATPQTTLIATQPTSNMLVDFNGKRTRLMAHAGEALAASGPNRSVETKLISGTQIIFDGDNVKPSLISENAQLIKGDDFSDGLDPNWIAYTEGEHSGIIQVLSIDDQEVVVIDRSQQRFPNDVLGHGETGLIQTINADTTNFDSLELRTTFRIVEQSLSLCGVAGSECPLMMRIVYTDLVGVTRTYIHGFYSALDPALLYPRLCDTCRSEHDQLSLNAWYTFNENLIGLVPPDQKPAFIQQVSLYASGHAYVVQIADIDLIGFELRR